MEFQDLLKQRPLLTQVLWDTFHLKDPMPFHQRPRQNTDRCVHMVADHERSQYLRWLILQLCKFHIHYEEVLMFTVLWEKREEKKTVQYRAGDSAIKDKTKQNKDRAIEEWKNNN